MPEPSSHCASLVHRPARRTLAALIFASVLVQVLAAAGIHHLRGTVTAYAFQSPDAAEYVNLARGLAWHGQYIQLDAAGHPLTGPDTWRTPGYPLFLALIVRLVGDSPLVLLIVQQLIAAATVPLLWLILRRLASPHWAMLAALAWCLDPFRVYYSFWLMSETLFTFILLLACWVWTRAFENADDTTSPASSTDTVSCRDTRSATGAGSSTSTTNPTNACPPLVRGGYGGVLDATSASPALSFRTPHSAFRTPLALGLLTGLLVLIRPIAAPLPLLAILGVVTVTRRAARSRDCWCENPFSHPSPRSCENPFSHPSPAGIPSRVPAVPLRTPHSAFRTLVPLLACLLGLVLTLGPWLLRNHMVAGHFALSQQSGASLAYHKVVDVVLWSEGRPQYRFDSDATAEIRDRIDRQLQQQWPAVYGPATSDQIETLTWENLNFGKPIALDPFKASSLLWSVGLKTLADRPWAMLKCFTVQGLFMLVFPLGLVLWPPAGTGSAPLSMLFGGKGFLAAKLIPAAIGATYAALVLWILIRLIAAAAHRRWPAALFALLPALAMFAFSLPSEDPRFRLPLIPLFWIIAVARNHFAFPPAPRSNPST